MTISELVNKFDVDNQFEVIKNSYQQIEYAISNEFDLTSLEETFFDNIVISGLGGSAISGDLLLNFCKDELPLPVIVNRNYSLPSFADNNTLVICSSYSGNTEETLSVLKQAIEINAPIICMTTGGKMKEIAEKNNIPVVKLKPGYQPRYALAVNFFTLLRIFQTLSLIDDQSDLLNSAVKLWKELGESLSTENNSAFNFANKLLNTIPVIYSCADFNNAVGTRFKGQLNENSKLHAFVNVFPELNHNEIIGWENRSECIQSIVFILDDEEIHPQIKKRYKITSELIKQNGIEIVQLQSNQNSFKLRLLELVFLVDWISYYAALLNEKDPSEIEYIHLLKERLAQ